MGEIAPSEARVKAMLEIEDKTGPFVMLNLLRFKDKAEYAENLDVTPCSGAEAFRRYGEGAAPSIESLGARAIYSGNAILSWIARPDEEWDAIALVEYPSWDAFIELGTKPEYQAIAFHREAALSDSRLIITRPDQIGLG